MTVQKAKTIDPKKPEIREKAMIYLGHWPVLQPKIANLEMAATEMTKTTFWGQTLTGFDSFEPPFGIDILPSPCGTLM